VTLLTCEVSAGIARSAATCLIEQVCNCYRSQLLLWQTKPVHQNDCLYYACITTMPEQLRVAQIWLSPD